MLCRSPARTGQGCAVSFFLQVSHWAPVHKVGGVPVRQGPLAQKVAGVGLRRTSDYTRYPTKRGTLQNNPQVDAKAGQRQSGIDLWPNSPAECRGKLGGDLGRFRVPVKLRMALGGFGQSLVYRWGLCSPTSTLGLVWLTQLFFALPFSSRCGRLWCPTGQPQAASHAEPQIASILWRRFNHSTISREHLKVRRA